MNKNISPEEIKKMRKSFNLTLEQAANLVSVDKSAWCHWEKGNRKMKDSYLQLFYLKIKNIEDKKCI